ncbi:MAG TPA: hypothetical protein VLJ41_06605 [Segetibacter sp.]|nr:hypothetical protein [Segetibacter sp.]
MNTLRNVAFSLCLGSIVAIAINFKIGPVDKFSSTAFSLGLFVTLATFVLKPIRQKLTSV